jgi:hypothetical protein
MLIHYNNTQATIATMVKLQLNLDAIPLAPFFFVAPGAGGVVSVPAPICPGLLGVAAIPPPGETFMGAVAARVV